MLKNLAKVKEMHEFIFFIASAVIQTISCKLVREISKTFYLNEKEKYNSDLIVMGIRRVHRSTRIMCGFEWNMSDLNSECWFFDVREKQNKTDERRDMKKAREYIQMNVNFFAMRCDSIRIVNILEPKPKQKQQHD